MELNEKLSQFIERIDSIKGSIQTEEATKTSMVMPFFQLLGYEYLILWNSFRSIRLM